MPFDSISILKTSLLDLLHEIEGRQIPLILAGGYGLYLKQLYMQENNSQTLIEGSFWPRPRATEDLDILIRTDIIVDADRLRPVRDALDALGYMPIRGAEYMQFVKDFGDSRFLKVDFLTGPLEDPPRVRGDDRRIRPRISVGLHAHRTDEAVAFQEESMKLKVEGVLSSGHSYVGEIYIPQAFTYLLMKLFAFRDQKNSSEQNNARHHALDIFRIVAMLTRDEYDLVKSFVVRYQHNSAVTEARDIIKRDFHSPNSLGSIRLQEHNLFIRETNLMTFLDALEDLFSPAIQF
jgi:hypothetical protein